MKEYKSDIEIAQGIEPNKIIEIAEKIGLSENDIEYYGKYKAKININSLKNKEQNGKLILVTAITPTPAGEGKTTTSIGLADAMSSLGKKTILALREPSLGPVFGIKGGATGGGYSQVIPMEDINLHFTGDFHAIGAANNLLAAMIDNHIQHGNKLKIDPKTITWTRCLDMNDRQLRFLVDGLGGRMNGVPREDSFCITVASEIMAIFCLATNLMDLKKRISEIIIGYSYDNNPITAGDLKAQGAMTALLKDSFNPNLVQTLEHTPAIVHGGPFANIAHGCNSLIATQTALKLGDYVVTEAGFGADLGAEKFLDIKCNAGKLKPDACVLVATCRALKNHGGVSKEDLDIPNIQAVKKGFSNLKRHIENLKNKYKLNLVVAINAFPSDTKEEIDLIISECEKLSVKAVLANHWALGGKGAEDLAKEVISLCDEKNEFESITTKKSVEEKIKTISENIYGAKDVKYTKQATQKLEKLKEDGYGNLDVCIAKTQYSFSDNPQLKGAPEDFEITVRDIKISAGANFVVVLTGDILTMPGLPTKPAAENIDVDESGKISGLF
ncbi:MAG: formate--tetrahydrofolate ligase [Clostridia bacterium]|nr:formate--tetrahydrofolate ligase [Clostridia bacterium]